MNRTTILLAGLAALTGCPTTTGKTSGDTGTTDTGPTNTIGTIIDEVAISCDLSDIVTLWASATGWVQKGGPDNEVFVIESANTPPWSEVHPLTNVAGARDADGNYDELQVTLTTRPYGGTTPIGEAYDPGVGSFFSCEQHYLQPVMTYVFAIDDADGVFADCFAYGENPDDVISETITGPNQPAWDMSTCATLMTNAR